MTSWLACLGARTSMWLKSLKVNTEKSEQSKSQPLSNIGQMKVCDNEMRGWSCGLHARENQRDDQQDLEFQ